jgi:hypothetical protein
MIGSPVAKGGLSLLIVSRLSLTVSRLSLTVRISWCQCHRPRRTAAPARRAQREEAAPPATCDDTMLDTTLREPMPLPRSRQSQPVTTPTRAGRGSAVARAAARRERGGAGAGGCIAMPAGRAAARAPSEAHVP